MNKGMLPAAAGGRPSLIRHLIGLYGSDTAFRGLVDFTAIGLVVLLFLGHLNVPMPNWSRSPSQPTTKTADNKPATPSTPPSKPDERSHPSVVTPSVPSTPPVATPAPQPPAVAFNFPERISNPKLGFSPIFDIDETAFRSSAAADQPRLAAAVGAVRAQQFAAIPLILEKANVADPNVAFMRGIAAIAAQTEDGNKAAVQAWRAAAEAGQRQAAIELARIETYAPPGVAKNDRARQVIEEAAATGNREAQRLAGIAHLSGQFGLDPAKARDLLGRSAQAGDIEAMLYYAFVLGWAVGGPADQAKAEEFLRRAAANGLTTAQDTLGIFLLQRFNKKLIDDPREGIDLLQKAIDSGYSLRALRALALFYGAQTQPPWNDKSNVYRLARLCSGVADGWCQAENGWVYQYGIGTNRDQVKAFAHYQIAADLHNASASKSLETLSRQISLADRTAAVELAKKIHGGLRPIPAVWDVQYPTVPPPAWPWNVAEEPPARVPTPAPTPAPAVPHATTVTPLPVMPLR